MKTKRFLLLLSMAVGLVANAQSTDKWTICVNKKKISTGTLESPGTATISTASKGKFTVRYSGTGKNDKKRSILIFDTERHELLRKDIANGFGKFTFNIDSLKAKTNGRTFKIYTVGIPKNPEEAALVRMAPMLLCDVSWKETVE